MEDIKFLTVAEIATLTRLSKMTIYRIIKSGELESIRFGRSFRVRESAVTAYMQAHTTQTS
jgi:excisionase family DNA binding protein